MQKGLSWCRVVEMCAAGRCPRWAVAALGVVAVEPRIKVAAIRPVLMSQLGCLRILFSFSWLVFLGVLLRLFLMFRSGSVGESVGSAFWVRLMLLFLWPGVRAAATGDHLFSIPRRACLQVITFWPSLLAVTRVFATRGSPQEHPQERPQACARRVPPVVAADLAG